MYGDILKSHPNSISILILYLVSVVYYIDFIRHVIDRNPGNLFSTLPILQDQQLLEKLSELITRKPSAVMKVTGVPPHITILKMLDSIKSSLEKLTSQFAQQSGRTI